jgi:sialate O-acetylesterase
MKKINKTISLLVLLALSAQISAKVKLEPLFSDNMVLQQKSEVKIWGDASANKMVKITTSWNKKTYDVTSDGNGHWMTSVSTPKAGGPYSVTISDGEPVVLKNVLIGEVWVCSGQSNMELMMMDRIIGAEKDIAEASKYCNIRLLHVENSASPVPVSELNVRHGGWQESSEENIKDFSATAYYFGKELFKALGCPIGLIETCWGGTYAEAWTSRESIKTMPDFKASLERVEALSVSLGDRQKQYENDMELWRKQVNALDQSNENSNLEWSKPDFDDSSWKELQSPGFIEPQGEINFDGIYWQRKTFEIPDHWLGKDLTLSLAAIDDNDLTYFNGSLVGQTEGCRIVRKYVIPGKLVSANKVTLAIRITDLRGEGGIYGNKAELKIALSDTDQIPLAGTWKYKISLTINQMPAIPINFASERNYPTALYNAMINPLINYTIRGAIWYQGEANEGKPLQYRDLFPTLINDWRTKWGYCFPFYYVQLPNFRAVQTAPVEISSWAGIREAQLNALHLTNTGMAVTIDVGEAADIHPRNKSVVGMRLAINALANTYGKNIEYSGPSFEKFSIMGDKIRIAFSHSAGMKSLDGSAIKGFSIAGADHKFYFANAVVDGNSIVVSCSSVSFPVAVRYAWAANPVCNLVNAYGLPASPFRTDNWNIF